MSTRSRIVGYGTAAALAVAGIAAAVFLSGETGQVLALVLVSLGFVLATSLVFLEVGLSEDRELARERERTRRPAQQRPRSRRGMRLRRMRGQRRRFK